MLSGIAAANDVSASLISSDRANMTFLMDLCPPNTAYRWYAGPRKQAQAEENCKNVTVASPQNREEFGKTTASSYQIQTASVNFS
jgi:hypothetical protein